jgi:heptosyltransferase-2
VSAHPSVLVVRFGALGDVVLATPLLRAIARAHPDATVTFVTKAAWAPLLSGHPHVADVVALAPGASVTSLATRLRRGAWDHRLDLHGSLRSRALRVLTGGRWRTAPKPRLRRAFRVWTGVAVRPLPHVAELYFRAARDLDVVPDGDPARVAPVPADIARAAAVRPPGPYVVLAPGAAHATKRWPTAHWNRLADQLDRRGLRTVVAGAAGDATRVTSPAARGACGIGLGPTAALLADAAVVVAGDTGLLHLATAVATPVVALFGPTDPALGYGPYRARAVVLARDLPCRPCSVYGGTHCPLRHHRCMIEITPDEVAQAVLDFLT